MLAFTLRRLVVALLVAVTVSIISFSLLRLSGDLAQALAGPSSTPADVAAVRKAYGLDQPLPVQYLDWVEKALHGDFGTSFFFKEPVWSMIGARLPVTMTLGLCALGFALVVAIPLGNRRGAAAELVDRPAGPDGLGGGPGAAELLVRPHADDLLRPQAALAADLGDRDLAAFRHAVGRARLLRAAGVHAPHPRRDDRSAGGGLYPDGARQRPALAVRAVQARAAQRASFRWSRSPPCSSASCSAARSSSRASSRCTASAISPGNRSAGRISRWSRRSCSSLAAFYVVLTLLADLLNAVLDPRIRLA